jgi:RHS repeat-associated protein
LATINNQPPTLNRVYAYGHDLISQDQLLDNGQGGFAWNLTFYGYDGHGNVRYLTDGAGNVTDTFDFDAYGTLVARTGTTPNAYLYCGEQFEVDLGLYFNRARYLNPDSGRFWTRDVFEGNLSSPDSLHKYLYAGANPVRFIDPSGQFSLSELQFVQQIQGMIRRTRERGVYQITRKSGCYMIEYLAEEAISAAVTEGLYLFVANSGLPYLGRSTDVERRLLRHEAAEKLSERAKNLLAKFKFVGTEAELRNMEQWLIDKVKDTVNLASDAPLRDNGLMENQRNELGKSARQKVKEVIKICK